jgi:hypothetical protein
MVIRTYAPSLSVVLTRLVNRTGGKASSAAAPFKTIDLTPYLGTAGTVRTIKSIDAPCGGFSVTFADRIDTAFADTVYAEVEPMDLVEIRASRSPERYVGTTLPLIMRGFVSTVDRAESMSQAGKPERTVTIAGQDMGKLMQIHHVYFETFVLTDQDYLSTFHLFSNLGIEVQALPVNTFMHQLVENVVNKKISDLGVFSDTQIQPFVVDASVPDGIVIPQLAMTMDQFSLWELAELFADRPWNEMMVVDQEDGPHFVFRPAPYKDLYTRNLLLKGATDPGTIAVDITDIVAMTAVRTDARVANLFIVDASASMLDTNGSVQMQALQQGVQPDFAYDGNKPELFGTKKMGARTTLWQNGASGPVNALPPGQQAQASTEYKTWFVQRTEDIKAMNRDNAAFEDLGMICKGSEDLLIGHYLQLTRGSLMSESYITQVSHSFQPLSVWTTSLHCIRGTGFVDRNLITTGSPYHMEGRTGPYAS